LEQFSLAFNTSDRRAFGQTINCLKRDLIHLAYEREWEKNAESCS